MQRDTLEYVSIDELLSKLSADTDSTNTLHTQLAETISQGQALTQSFQGLGAEAVASTVTAGTSQVEEAQSLASALADKLQEAHTTFETAKQHLTGGSPAGSSTAGFTRAIVGDPITAPEPKPGPNSLRRELDNPDDGDEERKKIAKLGNALSRNSEDLSKQFKETVQSSQSPLASFKPIDSAVGAPQSETVGIQDKSTHVLRPIDKGVPTDALASLVMVGAVVVTAVGRLTQKRNTKE